MAFEKVNKGFYIQGSIVDDTENTSYDISGGIEDIIVKKSFIENSFPLYVADIKTTEEIRDIMRDHEIRLSLRISSYNGFQYETTEGEDSYDIPEEDVIFDDTLRIYEKPYPTTSSKKDEENDDESESVSTSVNTIYYRISGIPEKLIEKNSQVINKVFENAKADDVLVNILTENDSTSDLYVQETSNKTQFDSIIIPPMSLIPAINYLQEYYGLYEGGLNIFIDSSKSYIYSPLSADSENIIEVKVKDINTDSANNSSSDYPMVDEDNNIQIIMNNSPAFRTERKISGDEVGSSTIYYSYDENFNLNKRVSNDSENYTKIRYFWNGVDSIIKEQEHANISKADDGVKFSISSINPELITPLTGVSIDSPVFVIKGQYFIADVVYLFNTSDYKHYSMFSNIGCVKKQ